MWCRVGSGHAPSTTESPRRPDLHRIVRDKPMTTHDEIERAFTLADAAVADDQHAEAQDVHEHAVNDLANRQRIVEQRADSSDGNRRGDRRAQQRHVVSIGSRAEVRVCLPSAGDQHARNVVSEGRVQHVHARVVRKALEISHLALAEDDDPPRTQVLVKTGERQTCLLDVGTGDAAIEPRLSAEQLERKARRT